MSSDGGVWAAPLSKDVIAFQTERVSITRVCIVLYHELEIIIYWFEQGEQKKTFSKCSITLWENPDATDLVGAAEEEAFESDNPVEDPEKDDKYESDVAVVVFLLINRN